MIKSEIIGTIEANSLLSGIFLLNFWNKKKNKIFSGMPTCKIGFNEKAFQEYSKYRNT